MQIFKMLTCFIIQYKKLHLPDVTCVNQKQSLRSLDSLGSYQAHGSNNQDF